MELYLAAGTAANNGLVAARLARATEAVADPALTAIYATRKPSTVTPLLGDGRRVCETVEDCRGEPENPADAAAVTRKFEGPTAPFLGGAEQDERTGLVLSIDRVAGLGRLFRLLRSAGR